MYTNMKVRCTRTRMWKVRCTRIWKVRCTRIWKVRCTRIWKYTYMEG